MAMSYSASDDPREARMRAQAYMKRVSDDRVQPNLPNYFGSQARDALSDTGIDTAIHFGAASTALNSQAELIGARAQADHMEKMAEINAANLKAQQRAQQRAQQSRGLAGVFRTIGQIGGGLIGGPIGAGIGGALGGLIG